MSPPLKRHLELEIDILQKGPKDADKLERLLKVKKDKRRELYTLKTHKG
jgi:hypothetical protein